MQEENDKELVDQVMRAVCTTAYLTAEGKTRFHFLNSDNDLILPQIAVVSVVVADGEESELSLQMPSN